MALARVDSEISERGGGGGTCKGYKVTALEAIKDLVSLQNVSKTDVEGAP